MSLVLNEEVTLLPSAARTLTYTVTGSANTLVQFSTTVLNRIVGGGGTTIKKIVNFIFDD